MIEVFIKKHPEKAQVLLLKIQFEPSKQKQYWQLPAWRPGRYELQNFAKNVLHFSAKNADNKPVAFTKITKDLWELAAEASSIAIEYYAAVQDAGSSFVDQNYLYVNFVNCVLHPRGHLEQPVKVFIEAPTHFGYACGLTAQQNNGIFSLSADSYFELYDSPFIASPYCQSAGYQVGGYNFLLHFVGEYSPNFKVLLPKFEAFTALQIAVMGGFPEQAYHFIHYILPHSYYHGVEHGRSTMLVLGPDSEGDGLNDDILGLCSHELFHAWNICKIRPKQLLPYNFSQEQYFDTGFVVEGVTTYLGDLFLLHSGVLNKQSYLKELNAVCFRHFLKQDTAGQSLVETSIDLWVDGYVAGVPGKKVSIYNKGALVAMMLDVMIRERHGHKKSLYDVMRAMWQQFGQPGIGYSLQDYKNQAESVLGENLDGYFDHCILSNKPIQTIFNQCLAKIGLLLVVDDDSTAIEELPGFEENDFSKAFFEKIIRINNAV